MGVTATRVVKRVFPKCQLLHDAHCLFTLYESECMVGDFSGTPPGRGWVVMARLHSAAAAWRGAVTMRALSARYCRKCGIAVGARRARGARCEAGHRLNTRALLDWAHRAESGSAGERCHAGPNPKPPSFPPA